MSNSVHDHCSCKNPPCKLYSESLLANWGVGDGTPHATWPRRARADALAGVALGGGGTNKRSQWAARWLVWLRGSKT
jgi:hypothetical protein